tara:strand:- start:1140 stop:1934 length:795 start_codon:yes stop_codon:yes gene_type:complete
MKKINEGTVYLVGAGPGDPELLTVKAMRLLEKCDALVYDALIPEEFLKFIPLSCKCCFVGKRCGQPSVTQAKINKLLVELAKDFSCVVRLKGGDPFLFGRGSEEAEWLVSHNICVEVVPGITSGMAAPAYFGIPVTHRQTASSVTFVTGHERHDKDKQSVKWRKLAKGTDGLVIYMAMKNLDFIVHELIQGGLAANTPAVIINQGTLIGQQYIKTSMENLVLYRQIVGSQSPSIVLIGNVINHQIEQCNPMISRFCSKNNTQNI